MKIRPYGQDRGEKIWARVSAKERLQLQKEATRRRMSLSELIRDRLLRGADGGRG